MKLTELTKDLFDYIVSFRAKVASASVLDIQIVSQELQLIFRKIEEQVSRHPNLALEYRQAKYPLVVLADEIILTSSWRDAKQWERFLLEKRYFSSNIGGNQFFNLMRKLDQMPKGVIEIYFYCLAFGFRGGFQPNDPSVQRLKGRLLQHLLPKDTLTNTKISPEAYSVMDSGKASLSKLWQWRDLVIASAISFILLMAIGRLAIWPFVIGFDIKSSEDNKPQAVAKNETAVSSPGFTIQLGNFKGKTLALHFATQMRQKNIDARVIVQQQNDGQLYLVLTKTFETEKAAQAYLQNAQQATTLVTEMKIRPINEIAGNCIEGCQ